MMEEEKFSSWWDEEEVIIRNVSWGDREEEDAKRLCLRTHTTCISAHTLAKLKPEDLPAKFFAIGKVFRNETIDWKHNIEFNQTEGIVVDKNANFKHSVLYMGSPVKFINNLAI